MPSTTTSPAPTLEALPATVPATVAPVPPASAAVPPGEEISVSADLVEFGVGLVGLGSIDQADGHIYVIAGRFETEEDRFVPPENGVLAAFDATGNEVWRTQLDGSPRAVVAAVGYVWVQQADRLSRIDGADGTLVGEVDVPNADSIVGGLDAVWVVVHDSDGSSNEHLVSIIRVDPDLSTTTIALPPHGIDSDDEARVGAVAGAGRIWVNLVAEGVAAIDPDTLETTVIPSDQIGHAVHHVAVDGDVVYVASGTQVTSLVDGAVGASTSPGDIWYLGHIDGVFGVLQPEQRFTVLKATDPMAVEVADVSEPGRPNAIGGEAWVEADRNGDLRRLELTAP